MFAVKAHFDGKQIVLPAQLQGAAPQEVLVVLEHARSDEAESRRGSIFDAIGKAPHPRTTEDINRQVREERESWGDR